MHVQVRPARPEDWPQFQTFFEHDRPIDSPKLAFLRFLAKLESQKAGVFVAEIEGELVGVAMAHEWHTYLMSGLKQIRFSNLKVKPAHRKQGIGRALFEHTRDWAKAQDACWFEWYASKDAIGFYERMGYRGQVEPDTDHPYFEIVWK